MSYYFGCTSSVFDSRNQKFHHYGSVCKCRGSISKFSPELGEYIDKQRSLYTIQQINRFMVLLLKGTLNTNILYGLKNWTGRFPELFSVSLDL